MKKVLFSICLGFISSIVMGQIATTTIPNINATVMNNTPLLFGITFDARTSMTASDSYGSIGYYNANTTVIPEVDAIFNDFLMSTLRYPANAVSFGFSWKNSVGPVASRPNQPASMLGSLGGAQPMNFGFDEFMAMTAARGVSPADVQIMVQIYDSASTGLTPLQMSMAINDPVGTNADWVEYCNAPNDSSNPGGGIDWAARRAANGHPAPYGIKIWNIGNEPWAPGEFGNMDTSANNYLAYVTPMINAMLAIDPTLHITLPVTGYAATTTSWAHTILFSSIVAQHRIYGVSQHFFMNENVNGGGTIPVGVVNAQTSLTSMVNVANSKGVKVLVGDYAHSIQCCSLANDNLAMQWQGVNLETDFLLMVSQQNNIDRTNFWAYGTVAGTFTWKPIRRNSLANYTLMPAAAIYKKLFPAFLDKSLAVITSSPSASDGNIYAVRSGAFRSTDGTLLNYVAVNRDKLNSVPYHPNVVSSYSVVRARLLTATSLQAEVFTESVVSPDSSGNYSMPALSILILECTNQTTSLDVRDGWNMVSVPLTVGDGRTTTLFPTAVSQAFAYQGSYQPEDTLKNGPGYWLRFAGVQNVQMTGLSRTVDTINVTTGWNLIGSISGSVAVSSITSNPPGIVASNFFGYDISYAASDSVEPGKAYWVKASQSGILILSASPSIGSTVKQQVRYRQQSNPLVHDEY